MKRKGKVQGLAEEFVKQCGFNYLVVSRMTEVGTRMATYYPNENKIIIDPRKIYQSHKRFKLSLMDFVHILIARELGRSMDGLLEERNNKIDKAFQLIEKGFYFEQIKSYLVDLKSEEEEFASMKGREFINKEILDQYDNKCQRYHLSETSRIGVKAKLEDLSSRLKGNSIENNINEILKGDI
ncbi:hypothetical protein V7149_24855 [Bacillus sp. JJ1503]|uniref:hypothetical protein n=1 Tax=Bacillus sp. JJ1503 TaxID=3122956 RepID=UPI002FFD87D7